MAIFSIGHQRALKSLIVVELLKPIHKDFRTRQLHVGIVVSLNTSLLYIDIFIVIITRMIVYVHSQIKYRV